MKSRQKLDNEVLLWSGTKQITAANTGIDNWFYPSSPSRINPTLSTFSLVRYIVALNTDNATQLAVASWHYCETSKGVFDWTYTDSWVNEWYGMGKDMLVELAATPDWANLTMTAGKANKAPTNMADFADWVQAIGTRYNGKIKYWTIRNEPVFNKVDDLTEYRDTEAKYAEMMRIASQILKYINPENKILAAEMMNIQSPQLTMFTNLMSASAAGYDVGTRIGIGAGTAIGLGTGKTAKDFLDIVSFHPYVGSSIGNEDNQNQAADFWKSLKQTMVTLGVSDKPCWASEYMDASNHENTEILKMKRSQLFAWLCGGCDMHVWFGWGRNSGGWTKNDANGVATRAVWDSWCNLLFSSPIIKMTLVSSSNKIKIYQQNGIETVI